MGSVQKTNSGAWREARTVLEAPEQASTLQHISHVRLMDLDTAADAQADDDVFCWLEVSKVPFLFNFTETVVDIKP